MNEDTCKKILITFECLLAAHPNIKFRFEKQTYRNVVSSMPFHPESNAINTIKALNQFNIEYHFDFGIFYDKIIIDRIGAPFTYSISSILYKYTIGEYDDEHINIWLKSIEHKLPVLVDELDKTIISYTGSEKWIYFLNKRIDSLKNIINESVKNKFSINSIKIEKPTYGCARYRVYFIFNRFLNYYLKNNLQKSIFNKLKPIYDSALNTNIESWNQFFKETELYYYYMSNCKTTPTDTLIFEFPSNSWNSIAISEDAQYLPKLGHKKNGC